MATPFRPTSGMNMGPNSGTPDMSVPQAPNFATPNGKTSYPTHLPDPLSILARNKPKTPTPQAPVLPPSTGPIFPDDPVQPIAFNGGQQHYNPTTAPFGFDMSGPGTYQQLWDNNQNLWMQSPQLDWVNSQLSQFEDPWASETFGQQTAQNIGNPGAGQQYWAGLQGGMNTPTGAESIIQQGYKGPNNSQVAFDMTKSRVPQSFQPGFDAYYDRMKDKMVSDVNAQSAARGSYGSNAALNGSIGTALDVEAQRAKAHTDFMFKDSENQRNWMDSLGTIGRNADLTDQGGFQLNIDASKYGLDKTKTYGDLAFRAEEMDYNKQKTAADIAFEADEMKKNRLDSGISTAFGIDSQTLARLQGLFGAGQTAQNMREGRIGSLYDDVGGFSSDVISFLGEGFDQLLGLDGQELDEALTTMIAKEADLRGWDQTQQDRMYRDAKAVLDAFTGKKASAASQGEK